MGKSEICPCDAIGFCDGFGISKTQFFEQSFVEGKTFFYVGYAHVDVVVWVLGHLITFERHHPAPERG